MALFTWLWMFAPTFVGGAPGGSPSPLQTGAAGLLRTEVPKAHKLIRRSHSTIAAPELMQSGHASSSQSRHLHNTGLHSYTVSAIGDLTPLTSASSLPNAAGDAEQNRQNASHAPGKKQAPDGDDGDAPAEADTAPDGDAADASAEADTNNDTSQTDDATEDAKAAKGGGSYMAVFFTCLTFLAVLFLGIIYIARTSESRDLDTRESPEAYDREEGLRRIGFMFGGLKDDYARRFGRHALSDYTDAFSGKTLSAAIFMFFATFTSTLALGEHLSMTTKDKMGTKEYLIMNIVAGVFHSIFGCQPLLVLRPTGPITLVITKLVELAAQYNVLFFPLLAWTGVFIGSYMLLISFFELARFTKLMTEFSKDIFAFFVCSIYVWDGIQMTIHVWHDHPGKYAECLLATNFTIAVVVMAVFFSKASESRFCARTVRRLLVDYALFLSIVCVMLAAGQIDQKKIEVFFIKEVKLNGKPTLDRPWLTNIVDTGGGGVIILAAMVAIPITIFFYMDQNISAAITQQQDMKLCKGSYYHSSFFTMGIANMVGPMFGLPFVTGSLPHSPQFVIACSEIDPNTLATTHVVENRVTAILTYSMLAVPVLFPKLLAMVPMAVISGTLFYVGLEGLQGTTLYDRLMLMPADTALYPKTVYTKVSKLKMHLYTVIQLFCWAGCWVCSGLLGLAFPLWVAMLIPIRSHLVPICFTQAELARLDCDDEAELADSEGDEAVDEQQPSLTRGSLQSKRYSALYERP